MAFFFAMLPFGKRTCPVQKHTATRIVVERTSLRDVALLAQVHIISQAEFFTLVTKLTMQSCRWS